MKRNQKIFNNIGKENLIYRDKAKIEKKYCKKSKNFREGIDPSKGIENYKYFYAFLFGGILGTVYEDFLILFMKNVWRLHSGVLWLPFNPLYGFGCMAFVWVLSKFDKWYHKLTYGALLGGAVEYYASMFQEIFTHAVSWNYADKITNIDGRTTVIYALGWGIMGYTIYTYVWPYALKLLRCIPYYIGHIYTKIFKIFIIVVMIISYLALFRIGLKAQGIEPITIIGTLLDKYLPYEYVKLFFFNMKMK